MIFHPLVKSATLFAALAFAIPSFCTAATADFQAVPTIETSSPGGVEVSSANGRWVKGRLLVSGVVHRKAGYSYPGPIQSHLDFLVLDARQRPVNLTRSNYLPRTIPIAYRGIPSQAGYAQYLPVVPPAGGRVRVTHHEASIEDCRRDQPNADHTKTQRRPHQVARPRVYLPPDL